MVQWQDAERTAIACSPALTFRLDRHSDEIAMVTLNVKDGTPTGSTHLCRSCVHCQFTTGYRETDVLVICTNASPSISVPFPVRECTAYWDRNRPTMTEMQKFALNFSHERRKPIKGFSMPRLKVVAARDVQKTGAEKPDEAALAE